MERGGEQAGHPARRAARAGPEHPPARRAPRVPADLQRAQDPALTEARAPEPDEARRPLPVRPRRGDEPGPGRGAGSRAGSEQLTSQPARPRLAPVQRRSCASGWKASLPRSAPSRPGPAHIAIAAPATTAKPGACSSRTLGSQPRAAGEHAQSPRSQGCPAGERYLRSTGPGPRPRP